MVFGTTIPTFLYIFGKCFSYLFVCLFVVPHYYTGDCLSLSSAPTPLVCMYVSVFVEKGLAQNLDVSYLGSIMFFILVCVPFCCTTLPYRRLSLSRLSTNTFSMHVSVFVEKGLSCLSNLDVSNSKLGSQYQWLPSTTRRIIELFTTVTVC